MAAIVFREDQPGILAIENRVDIGWVLAPEPLLDFSLQTQNCDLIKGTLDIAPITDANFRHIFAHYVAEETDGKVDIVRDTYGPVTQRSSMIRRLRQDDMNTIAYNFNINIYGDDMRHLRQLVAADQWIENEGVLPLTHPLWACISAPEFTVFGPGAKQPMNTEMHQFGLVYCLLRGRQTLKIIPKGATTSRMCDDLRRRLRGSRFPQETLQCDKFLQHSNLYYNDDLSLDNYDAKTVELNAGQFVIIQSGVYFQSHASEAGLAVSFSCVPRTWQTAQNIEECIHVRAKFTLEQLEKIRENARIVKNQVARTLFLNAMGRTRAIVDITPMIYPQRVAAIHEEWGGVANNGSDSSDDSDDSDDGINLPGAAARPVIRGGAMGAINGAGRGRGLGNMDGGVRRVNNQEEEEPVLQQAPDEDANN